MKLIFIIIQDVDKKKVSSKLSAAGHRVTMINSSGGFLKSGNTTLLIGAADDHVDEIISIVKENSKKRKRSIDPSFVPGFDFSYADTGLNSTAGMDMAGSANVNAGINYEEGGYSYNVYDIEVDIGGATIFVLGCN